MFHDLQREPDGKSSLSAFLTSVNASPTKGYSSFSGRGKAVHAKRPRSSCGGSTTNEQERRGRKRRRTVHAIVSRTGAVRSEKQEKEEEDEVAHISGSSSGDSDGGTTTVSNTVLEHGPTKHKQDVFASSRTGSVASFLRPSGHQLGNVGQHDATTTTSSSSSRHVPHRIGAVKQPTSRSRKRKGLARMSDYGTSELDLVETSSDSDNEKVEPKVLCRSDEAGVQHVRRENKGSKITPTVIPSSDAALAEALSVSVTSSSGQVVVGSGVRDMSVFVQSLGAENEEDAAVREEEEEQICTSNRYALKIMDTSV